REKSAHRLIIIPASMRVGELAVEELRPGVEGRAACPLDERRQALPTAYVRCCDGTNRRSLIIPDDGCQGTPLQPLQPWIRRFDGVVIRHGLRSRLLRHPSFHGRNPQLPPEAPRFGWHADPP